MTMGTFIKDMAAGLQDALMNGWLGENWSVIATGLFATVLVWGIVVLVLGEEYEPRPDCSLQKGGCR